MVLLFYVLLLLIPLLLSFYVVTKKKHRVPPGPFGLPIIGHLHLLGELPHHSLFRLSNKYGPLMLLKLGRIPTFVASSPETAEEIMKTHDIELCGRPPLVAHQKFSYGGLDIGFSSYSEQWRQLRRLTISELFSPQRVQSFKGIREAEVNVLLDSITKFMMARGEVNLSEMLLCLFNNITYREVFGKRVSEVGECSRSMAHDLIMEMVSLMGGFCFGDFFPGMEWLDVFTGSRRRLEKSFRGMDGLFEKEIEEHLGGGGSCGKSGESDFLSVLLELEKDSSALGFPLTRDRIKAVLMNMLIGGTDTSASTVEWGMTELMRNPRVLKKAQEEVRRVVGSKGKVEETDLPQLHYLKLVINETLRLHPPGPLLIPRECMADCKISGYVVPAKTRVYINAWAVNRDPRAWKEPESFLPERFENSSVSYKGQHYQFIPFGAGRRICPGLPLGVAAFEFAFANILYGFDWELPEGMSKEDIDMDEHFGLVAHKKTPLVLVAKPAAAM